MKIFDHFQHINLTTDQHHVLEQLQTFLESKERVFVIQGYAGSGKTTLLKGLVEFLMSLNKKYHLMAPTGRAAKVINQKTGFEASTIHKGIYSFEELQEIKQGEDDNIVSFLYHYKLRNNPEVHDSILIIDEASMVSDIMSQGEFFRFGSGHLLKDLITYGRIQDTFTTSKIIFIGDPAQLPPIGMNFSPALDTRYLEDTYRVNVTKAEMREVKRQDSNNSILLSATKIRRCLTSGHFNDFDLRANQRDIFNPDYQHYFETYKEENEPKIIICYKNKTALDLNREIRSDKFGDDLPIQASDRVIIGGNNYRLGIMNGEFAIVAEADPVSETRAVSFYSKGGKTQTVKLTWRRVSLALPDERNQTKNVRGFILENYLYGDNYIKPEEQQALYIDFKNRNPKLKKGTEEFKEAILNDRYFNCILLKYGYAVTCHKAQGGEWSSAFVFWDYGIKDKFNFFESEHNHSGKTNPDFYRWAYTAVTRASKKLFCINPPYFSSFSNLTFIEVNVQNALDEFKGKISGPIEIDMNEEVLEKLVQHKLKDAPISYQDHFIQQWYHLDKNGIEIQLWKKVGYEIWYVFKKNGKIAGLKYWTNKKDEIGPSFLPIPSQTTSNELLKEVTDILDNSQKIEVNRTTAEGILDKVQFETELEESKPFLKSLYEGIIKLLMPNELIEDLTHLSFKERYTFTRGIESCVVDFEYNGSGFFGRVVPLERRCNSINLKERIKEIVNQLKDPNYVI